MDKKDWSWLPKAMPGVARLMVERRAEVGDAHVNDCWVHGVVRREPGWFFAREGALAVGTPWSSDPVLASFAAANIASGQALLVMANVGGPSHGT